MSTYPFASVGERDAPYAGYVAPPSRALNGGLYTGEPFVKNAPWANVPVIPDTDYMTHVNLRSANPPLKALFQYPGNTRPGNNFQENIGHIPYEDKAFDKPYNFTCIPCEKVQKKRTPCICNRNAPISGNEVNAECECDKIVYLPVT